MPAGTWPIVTQTDLLTRVPYSFAVPAIAAIYPPRPPFPSFAATAILYCDGGTISSALAVPALAAAIAAAWPGP